MVRTQPLPAGVEYVLLGLLATEPCHGYELHKKLDALQGIGLVWRIKQANLYALLDKLERKGWIQSQIIHDDQRQKRKQYSLNDIGRRAWMTWQQSPVLHGRDMHQDFLSRLYFAGHNGQQAVQSLVASQQVECCNWLEKLQTQYNVLAAEQDFDRKVIQFRIHQVQGMLAWLAQLTKSYDNDALDPLVTVLPLSR